MKMKKQVVLAILIINLVSFAGSAQHTFQKTISKPYLQTIYDVKEDADKNIVLVGRVIQENNSKGYVLKISENGEVLISKIFPFDIKGSIFYNLNIHNNHYYIFGM